MNYFIHAMPREKIRKVVDKLLSICDDMDDFEDNMLDLEFFIDHPKLSSKAKKRMQKEIGEKDKLKNSIELAFQAELSALSDFNYLARNYTSELLEAISEVDPDAVDEEAVNNSKTGRE